jgi:hypothetical protein
MCEARLLILFALYRKSEAAVGSAAATFIRLSPFVKHCDALVMQQFDLYGIGKLPAQNSGGRYKTNGVCVAPL